MTKIAESSGTVIHESGSKLYISKTPASWTSVFLFVTGLLAFILLANGILQFTDFKFQVAGSSTIGMTFIGAGLVFGLIFWKVRQYQKKISTIPPHELQTIAILDLENNTLLDHQQNTLAPLNRIWLTRKMQLTSSSPELMLQWDRGSISIAKGNPFSGGIAAIEKVLLSKGIKRK